MKVETWLRGATETLQKAGISTARLDALVLVEDGLKLDRGLVIAHPETELDSALMRQLNSQISRRARHEPLAYIRNKTEFYGREFYIDHRVLEPRPESENMIDILKSLTLPDSTTVLDVGTGSGMLAITTKLEFPALKVIATDIDKECLVVTRKNAKRFDIVIDTRAGNLLAPLEDVEYAGAVILANLPYVPDHFQINPAAMAEPRIAIFGGQDGLDIYRQLFEQLRELTHSPGYVLTESLPPQHSALTTIAKQAGYFEAQEGDFIQLFQPEP